MKGVEDKNKFERLFDHNAENGMPLIEDGTGLIYDKDGGKWFVEQPTDDLAHRSAKAADGSVAHLHNDDQKWIVEKDGASQTLQDGAETDFIIANGYPITNYQTDLSTLNDYYNEQQSLVERFRKRFFEHSEANINVPSQRVDEHLDYYTEVRGYEEGLSGEDLLNAEAKSSKALALAAGAVYNRVCDECLLMVESEKIFAISTRGEHVVFEQKHETIDELTALRKDVQKDWNEVDFSSLMGGRSSQSIRDVIEQDVLLLMIGRPSENEAEIPPLQKAVRYSHSKDKIDEFFGEPIKVVQAGVQRFMAERANKVGIAMQSMDELGANFDSLLDAYIEKDIVPASKHSLEALKEGIDNYKDAAKIAIQTSSSDGEYKDVRSDVSMHRVAVKRAMREIKVENIRKNEVMVEALTHNQGGERKSFAAIAENAEIVADLPSFFLENKKISQLEACVDVLSHHIDRVMEARVSFPETAKYLHNKIDEMHNIADKEVAIGRGRG